MQIITLQCLDYEMQLQSTSHLQNMFSYYLKLFFMQIFVWDVTLALNVSYESQGIKVKYLVLYSLHLTHDKFHNSVYQSPLTHWHVLMTTCICSAALSLNGPELPK